MHKRLFQQGALDNHLRDRIYNHGQDACELFAMICPAHCPQSRNINLAFWDVVVVV
jgi:hypothetical protein